MPDSNYSNHTSCTLANGTHCSLYNHIGKLLFKETNKDGQFYITSYLFLGSKQVAEDGILQPQINTKVHYRPFGDTIETPKDDIGYTGHKYDTDINLVYMQQRLMDPRIGRFYSNDPVGFSHLHNFNRYAYANNNPYRFVDPDGNNAALAACYAGPLACAAGVTVTLYAIHHGVKGTGDALNGYNQYNESSELSSDYDTAIDSFDTENVGSNLSEGEPNTYSDANNRSGNKKQRRFYGPDGKPIKDIDLDHPHKGMKPPHVHDYKPNSDPERFPIRQEPREPKPEELDGI